MGDINNNIFKISDLLLKKNNCYTQIDIIKNTLEELNKILLIFTKLKKTKYGHLIKDVDENIKSEISIKNDQLSNYNVTETLYQLEILKDYVFKQDVEEAKIYLNDFLKYNEIHKESIYTFDKFYTSEWLKIKIQVKEYENELIDVNIKLDKYENEPFIIFYKLYKNSDKIFNYINYFKGSFILKKMDYSKLLIEVNCIFKIPQYFYTITLWTGLKSIKIGNKISEFNSPTLEKIIEYLKESEFEELAMY